MDGNTNEVVDEYIKRKLIERSKEWILIINCILEEKKEIIKFEQEYKPEVTIITAYYNGDKYIDETINSVLNQTFPAWEWLIINDGSTNKESIEKIKRNRKN